MLPILEYFENVFQKEFNSIDTEKGFREYKLYLGDYLIFLILKATPNDKNENATCRKIIVGEKEIIHTEKNLFIN
jgi:hypothetical protein